MISVDFCRDPVTLIIAVEGMKGSDMSRKIKLYTRFSRTNPSAGIVGFL